MTEQLAFTPEPSAAVAVIVVVPTLMAETSPVSETVAIAVLPLDQLTLLLVALEGFTVAVNVALLPIVISQGDGEIIIDVTGTVVTFTVQVAVTPDPSAAVAVIVAVPALMPLTSPVELTVATDVLLLLQVIVLVDA